MSNELSKVEKAVQVVSDNELTMHLENLGLLKDLTPGEKNSYLQICKAFNLNPFKREVHVSKYNGQMSIITGYEVYLKRAERTGLLDGWKATTTGSVKEDNLKATVTIYRKDRAHAFEWEALYNECVQKTRDGVPTRFWQKAEFMTKKVAISQAFRLCFSDELGGMPYTSEEMGNEEVTQDIPHTVVDRMTTQEEADAIMPMSKAVANSLLTKENNKVHTSTLVPAKKAITQAALEKAVVRIKAGEVELIDKLDETFELKPEQVAVLEAALNEAIETEPA